MVLEMEKAEHSRLFILMGYDETRMNHFTKCYDQIFQQQ